MKQTVLSAGLVLAALAKNLDRAAEKRNISVAEALTVSGQTLNILGANDSPSTPLGPNQLNMHADFQSIRFPAPPLAVHNTI